jgi:cysteine desulfurase
LAMMGQKTKLLTLPTEHHAALDPFDLLTPHGFQTTTIPVDKDGLADLDFLKKNVDKQTGLINIMYVNNEVGTIQPIPEISSILNSSFINHKSRILSHTDATAAKYEDLNVKRLGVDLMTLTPHKFYGPKGIGVLYIRSGTPIIPLLTGGSQEFGLRAGTQNVPYIVGFAEAIRLAVEERKQRVAHVRPLRDRIIGGVLEEIPNSKLTGHPTTRLPNHSSFAFKGVDGNLLLTLLDSAGFACSSGSACKTGNPEPSEVMTSIGLSPEWGLGSLRVTLGVGTTPAQVEAFLKALPALVMKARALR